MQGVSTLGVPGEGCARAMQQVSPPATLHNNALKGWTWAVLLALREIAVVHLSVRNALQTGAREVSFVSLL